MNLWLVEPYYTGSHQAWADGYQAHSRHSVQLLTLPGRFWKWRMQGGAITLARQSQGMARPDRILASDMLNLPVFLALREDLSDVPVALYFHENQLTYPLQPGEKRDLHYGFINLVSALRAEAVFFNSAYHLEAFFDELPRLLKHFPDYNELWVVESLRAKSQVLPLGLDLNRLDAHRPGQRASGRPVILWNHRWEYDKDPQTFFRALYALADKDLDFELILLGESFRNQPEEFLEARRRLSERIVHFGYAEDDTLYSRLLWQADIVVSTARHEFFGAAIVEACYCGCFPILPRRLSYPELIPTRYHHLCLYDDLDDLVARLRHAVLHAEEIRTFSLQPDMARFDWRELAPVYDRLMEEMSSDLAIESRAAPSGQYSLPERLGQEQSEDQRSPR
ncbi:MAG: tRNA-queuosine alpha-mannosyltransferase domain-containing protein [Anaerolineae bacterium]